MPKPPIKKALPKPRDPKIEATHVTTEVNGYLVGLYGEFAMQVNYYNEVTGALAQAEARVDLAEKHLRTTRDHMEMVLSRCKDQTIPPDWSRTFQAVRFVGMRLADACNILLRENRQMTPHELLNQLNLGTFRFRTSTPLREIHAALLRQPFVERKDNTWVWTGTGDQITMPFRPTGISAVATNVPPENEVKQGEAKAAS